MNKFTYVLRAWHPDKGDGQKPMAQSNQLAELDRLAQSLNRAEQEANPGSELHYHAELAETPLMLPAVDQVSAVVRSKK